MYTINGRYINKNKIYENFDNVPSSQNSTYNNINYGDPATKNDLKDLINGLKNATLGDLYNYVKKDEFSNKISQFMSKNDVSDILNGAQFSKPEDLEQLNTEIRDHLQTSYTASNNLPTIVKDNIKINDTNYVTDLFSTDPNNKRILLNEICLTDTSKILNSNSENKDLDGDGVDDNIIESQEMTCINQAQLKDIKNQLNLNTLS